MDKIVILEKLPEGNRYRYLLRADVPASRQQFYADPTKQSAYKNITGPDLLTIQQGQVVERVDTISVQKDVTPAMIQAELIAAQAAFQNDVNNANPWQRYGTGWDGTSWTQRGVS